MQERRGPKGKIKTTMRLVKEPIRGVAEWQKQYGDPFWLESMNGKVLVSGREDIVKDIFRLGEDDVKPFAVGAATPLVGENSLLLTDGQRHKKDRKLLMPPFHGERMRAYNDKLQALAKDALRCEIGQTLDVHEAANTLALSAIVELVFGLEQSAKAQEMVEAITAMIAVMRPSFLFSKALQKAPFGLGPWASFTRARDETARLLREAISDKRKRGEEGDDILSLMLAARYDDGAPMSDAELVDQLRTLLIAGHETTAIAATWTAYCIHKNEHAKAQAYDAVAALSDEASEWARAPYVKALVDESLRVYPLIPEVIRLAKRELNVGGHVVRAGEALAASISLAHFSADNFEEPKAFKPERFLNKTYPHTQYMPFGGGIRRCIGAAFAKTEMCIFTSALLKQGRYELLDTDVQVKRRNLTLAPDRPIRLKRVA